MTDTDIVTRLPTFEDKDVQAVYALLCSDEAPPNREEHWEGWMARRIVAMIRPLVAEECAKVCDDIYLYSAEDDCEGANRCGHAIRAKFKEPT